MAAGTTFTIRLNAETTEANLKLLGFVNNITSALSRFLPQLSAALSFGAVAHQIDEATRKADELGKAAQRLGIAVAELSTLSMAAKLADVDMTSMGQAVKGLAQKVTEANNPLGESAQLFESLGISLRTQSGAFRQADDLLLQIADRFKEMPDGITKTRMATELFGRAGQNMIPLLNQGAAGIREAQYEAKVFGLEVGPEFAKNAELYRDNLTRIGAIWDGLWNKLAEALLPELVRFTDWFVEFFKQSGVHMGVVGTLIDIYRTFAQVVAMVAYEFEVFGAFVGAFFGSLSASGNPMEAWEDALDVVTEKTEKFMQRLEELNKLGEPGGVGKSAQGYEDPAKRKERLHAEYEAKRRELDVTGEVLKLSIRRYELDQTLSPAERLRKINNERIEELRLIKQKQDLADEYYYNKGLSMSESKIESRRIQGQQIEVQAKLMPESVADNLRSTMRSMVAEWGTMAQQIADGFRSVIGGAIQSISTGITGLIMRTKTWSQALAEIGTSILTSIVQAIVQMGIRWIATQVMMAVAGKAIMASATAATIPIALAQSAVWAAPATLATIASWGGAAAAAPGLIAAAQGITLASSLAMYAKGGYTGDGDPSGVAGLVHNREFVFSAPQVDNIGLGTLQALASGAGPASTASPSRGQNVTILSDERRFRDYANDPNFEGVFINLLDKHMWRYQA